MMKNLIIAVSALVALTACSKEDFTPITTDRPAQTAGPCVAVTLAAAEPTTKAFFDGTAEV